VNTLTYRSVTKLPQFWQVGIYPIALPPTYNLIGVRLGADSNCRDSDQYMPLGTEPAGVTDDDGSPGNWREYESVEDYEPEEFDPHSLGPDIPEVDDYADADVDSSVRTRFWTLVLVFNVAVLALAVGLMLIAFEGNWEFGGQLVAGGAVVSAYGFYHYRKTKQKLAAEGERGATGDSGVSDGTENREGTEVTDRNREAAATDRKGQSAGRRTEGMRTVEDGDGDRYILLKESAESSLVRDPETGERSHLPNDDLEPVAGESPLETATAGLSEEAIGLLTAVHDRRALGLLVEIDERGPVGVRALSEYDLCESDLHGLLGEFRAAGLIAERSVGGERGYDTTEAGAEALSRLRR